MAITPLVADMNHKNPVDFGRIAAAGIVGVIHKATQGTFVDNKYLSRRDLARHAGLEWGTYDFNTGDPVGDQVERFLAAAKPDARTSLWLDFEDNRVSQMSIEQAREFLDRVDQATGRPCGIYSGNRLKTLLPAADAVTQLFVSRHPLWLCQYKLRNYDTLEQLNAHIDLPAPWKQYFLLQYTGDGIGPQPHTVDGLEQGADLSTFNGTAAALRAAWIAT